jgi:hypothetical protein
MANGRIKGVMHPRTLLIVLAAFLMTAGCIAPIEPPSFGARGERPAEPEPVPIWGTDHCSASLSFGGGSGPVRGFRLDDQYGRDVQLYDFCARAVLVTSIDPESSQAIQDADWLQGLWEKYSLDGLVVLTLLGRDAHGGSPQVEDAASWAEEHGLSHPVLLDPDWQASSNYGPAPDGAPLFHLFGPGPEAIVVAASDLDEAAIEAALPDGAVTP